MQNIKEITVHPIDLSEFGKTPSGDPLYRVVWAPTRTEKVLVKSRDEVVELDRYPRENCWILEKWKSGLEWAGTPQSHEEKTYRLPISMEYPTDGEYERCDATFPDGEAVNGFARLYLQMLVYGFVQYTERERMQALKLREELKEKDADERASQMIRDALAPSYSGKRVNLYDAAGNIIH